jgi:PAS domain S-box-containing protein
VTPRSIGDGVISTDAQGRVTLLNPVAETLTGWQSAEASGQPLRSVFVIVNETTRQQVEDPVAKVLETGRVVGLANHTVLIARDGVERAIDDSAAPIRDSKGNINGVVLVFRDATAQRRTAAAVYESQRREKERADELEAILRATPTPIWIAHDPHCHRITGNPAAYQLLGLAEGANVSASSHDHDPNRRGFREYRGDEPIPVDELPMQNAVQGVSVTGTGVRFVFDDGRVRYIYGNAVPLLNLDGTVRGCVAAFADVTPLKEAEESLRRNQEVLKLVHQVGKIGHWEFNSLTNENRWSPEIEALYGLPPGGFEGGYEGWARLLHPDDRARAEEDVRRALQTGEYFTDFRVIWPDGSVHWLETRAHVVKDGHDRPVRFLDVTARKQMEEALRQSERRLASELNAMIRLHALSTRLLLTSDINTALADVLENAIVACGAAFGNIQLYNPHDQALEIVAQRGFSQDFLDHFRQVRVDEGSACAQAMQSGQRSIIEDVELDRSFEPHRAIAAVAGFRSVQSTPLTSREGGVIGMLSTHFRQPHRPSERDQRLLDLHARHAADLVDRRRFEAALLQSEAQFRQLADSMPQIVWTARPDGYIDYYNERWYEYTGLPRGQYGLPSWEAILHPDDGQHGVDTYFGCILAEKPYQIEYRFRDHKTDAVGLRVYAGHPLQVGDNLLGTLSFASRSRDEFHDDEVEFLRTICHYVAVAYERLRLIKQLRDADRKKDEFLATLAHELRNPLAPIRNAVEMLRRCGGDSALTQQAHSMMERQVDQMVRLVDDLLDMSRISRGKVQLRKEPIELSKVLRSAMEAVRPLVEARGHELTIAMQPDTIFLDADPTRLAQVISNLLNNAAKYTEKGGHIWLTAERHGDETMVSVRDTGIGIAAEHLPHLFEMFSQVAPALERSQGGLGIGLSLVKGLVELHGGKVEALSDGIGKGSEFVIRLPEVDVPMRDQPDGPPVPHARTGGRRYRILIVDDNRDAADSLAMVLSMAGHETRIAYDGLQAVETAADYRPDVVLLDIGLPRLNGYEAARQIRQQSWGKGMILVAVTGWGQEEDKRRASEAGFDHHLTKPVDPAVLESLLAVFSQARQR